jgi:hypothetical protein
MNKETLALLVMPPMFMALAVAVKVVLDPISPAGVWVLVVLAFIASLGCLARAVTLLKARRPLGYLCGAAAVLYIALLVIMCTPAKTRMTAQPARFSQQPPCFLLSKVERDPLLSLVVGPLLSGGCG